MQRSFCQFVSQVRVGILSKSLKLRLFGISQHLHVLQFLVTRGFIHSFSVCAKTQSCYLFFKFIENKSLIQDIKLFSRSTFSKTFSYNALLKLTKTLTGVLILETSLGLLTHFECLALGLGGRGLFIIFF